MEWKNLYRGIIMGATDVIPGISGGTIALLLGIYDRLIQAINGLLSKEWKKHLGFLLPLGLGMATAIFSLAKLIEWLFERYPEPLQFFFLGLILGILPYLFIQAKVKETFQAKHYVLLVLGALLIGSLEMLDITSGQGIIETRTIWVYLFLFITGVLASAAMILPGISGSMLMLMVGAYFTIMNALSNLYFDVIIVTGIGIAIGIFFMSRVIAFFLAKYHTATYACIIGFVFGSLVVVFPGWADTTGLVIASIITFASGLTVAYILGKIEYK